MTTYSAAGRPAMPQTDTDRPVKPFRARPSRAEIVQPDVYGLLGLADPGVFRLAVVIAAVMSLIIAGQIFVGTSLTILMLLPIVVGVTLVAFRDPWTAVLLLLGYGAMEGMYKYLSRFSTAVYMVAPGLLIVTAVAWGLFRRVRSSQTSAGPPPMAVTIVLFCIVAVIQSANPAGAGFVSSLAAAFLWYIGPPLMFLVAFTSLRSSRQVYGVLYVLLAIGTVVAGFAIVQQQMGREWCFAKLPGYETAMEAATAYTTFRPASTTATGGGAAAFAHFAIPAGLVLLLAPSVRPMLRVLIVGCLGICGVALLLAGVRLYVLIDMGCVASFLVLSARSPREMVRSLGTMVAVLLIFWVVTAVGANLSGGKILGRYASTLANPIGRFKAERGTNLDSLYAMVSDAPLGYGFRRGLGSYATTQGSTLNRETQFNCWQADMGLPGLIVGLTLCVQALSLGWRAYRGIRAPHLRPVAVMLFCFIATFLPGTLAGPTLQAAVNFFVLVAIAAALPGIEKTEAALIAEETERRQTEAAARTGMSGGARVARARAPRLPMVRG